MAKLIKIEVVTQTAASAAADVVILPAGAKNNFGEGVSPALVKGLKAPLRQRGFKSAWGSAVVIPSSQLDGGRLVKAPFIAVVGLGERGLASTGRTPAKLESVNALPLTPDFAAGSYQREETQAREGLRRGIGQVIRETSGLGLKKLAVNLIGYENMAGAAAESLRLASYNFDRHAGKGKSDRPSRRTALKEAVLLVTRDYEGEVKRAVKEAIQIAGGVNLARDLVNQPAELMTPKHLVEQAKEIAGQAETISLKILDRQQAAKDGWQAFLAVAKGSSEDPYVIHMTYRPRGFAPTPSRSPLVRGSISLSNSPLGRAKSGPAKVFLVGKGITFDSGGLSLKPAAGMQDMKIDMAGAASVLGVFAALDKLALPVEVHGVIAACENMPSGSAYRPGDIVTAKNGKTIEVLNTDAEGRVTLADALSYAVEQKPDAIIDVATLTGACMVALGPSVAGLLGTDDELKRQLIAAGQRAGEGLETLPTPEEYRPLLKSEVADIKNISTSSYGGAITAAMFLREFTGKIPWAHIDMAGPAWASDVILPYFRKGATGFGVRLLVEFLKGYGQEK